jgi:hypothetical protein
MLRATVWTVGLFGAGTAISRLFPWTWTEPLVLLGLGIALLFVSARTARSTTASAEPAPRPARPAVAPKVAAGVPAKAPAAVAAAAVQGTTVQMEVERTA